MLLRAYHVHRRLLFCGYVHMCKMCFCAVCAYVRGRVLAPIFSVDKCSEPFLAVFFAGIKAVFGVAFVKGVSFMPFVRPLICDSVWGRLRALIFDVVDGVNKP